jgi:hypothetical protein
MTTGPADCRDDVRARHDGVEVADDSPLEKPAAKRQRLNHEESENMPVKVHHSLWEYFSIPAAPRNRMVVSLTSKALHREQDNERCLWRMQGM